MSKMTMQRLGGAFITVMGCASVLLDGDATLAVLAVPLGLYMLLTKNCIMY